MSWMVVMGIGAVLGIASLVGIFWSLKKMEAPKKWGALVASLVVGAGGGFMVANATAIGTVDGGEQEVEEMEDFDAPLEDDWGDDDWGDEETSDEGSDDGWGDEEGDDPTGDEEGAAAEEGEAPAEGEAAEEATE